MSKAASRSAQGHFKSSWHFLNLSRLFFNFICYTADLFCSFLHDHNVIKVLAYNLRSPGLFSILLIPFSLVYGANCLCSITGIHFFLYHLQIISWEEFKKLYWIQEAAKQPLFTFLRSSLAFY